MMEELTEEFISKKLVEHGIHDKNPLSETIAVLEIVEKYLKENEPYAKNAINSFNETLEQLRLID